ncbi:aminotransferase class V-fold PLP-dependent enzyme [Streptomyces caelestis]|uniref:2-aminoethylphosphonate--pyruvate transaminase n=1 Tax=Streptomyces heliomycini TaxID=284032 RepID=A0ABV5L982_9ACTN|nr:aminotransferase class V-fold PLP-dependent enzyme [Streptomyces sp. XY152]KOV24011.1 aminotransferase [Streptomyces sp. XY152]
MSSSPAPAGSRLQGRVVLMNPGPVNVSEEVRAALSLPDLCHREPEALALMQRIRRKTVLLCGGDESHAAVMLAGSGTTALEATLSSIVPRDGRLLVIDNGHYGERLSRIVSVHGISCARLEFGWGRPVDVTAVDRALAEDPSITHVGLVHHETSTGMLNQLREIGAVVARHGRSLAVDAISSLGAEELDLAADHIDWCVGTANKCLEGFPGVSFVVAPRERLAGLADVPARTFSLDLHRHFVAQEHDGAPAFTLPLQVMAAFDTALDLALREGTSRRHARYTALAERIRTGLTERGLALRLPAAHRASSLTGVALPDGLTYEELHDGLKAEGFVVYSTQENGAREFRIANMGQLTEEDITGFLAAFDRVVDKHPGEGR